jgi:DNA invertase Pin-like site-specific DNA recombinase
MKCRRAFSYARFSNSNQAEGFSLARQLEAAKAYCDRKALVLDERSFCDQGVSGYQGSNAAAGDLAEFLELIRAGRVPKGSVLIIENVDRLTRLQPDVATALFMEVVNAGVDIVTLAPEQEYTKANIHSVGVWVPLQVAICLAHEESRKKSERLRDAWGRKRKALADGKKLSRRGPFWLKADGAGGWEEIPEKAALMRNIFRWSGDGLGVTRICERLHKEWPRGLTGRGWQPNNVRKLLRSRAALGELQPYVGTCAKKGGIKSTRRPAGPPVLGYFPAIVSETEFYKAQREMDGRRKGGGRSAGAPNLFNGMLYDATDRQRVVLNSDRRGRVLVSSGALRKMKGSRFRSLAYDVFERAILSALSELKPADVTRDSGREEDAVELWSGRLTAVNHKISQAQQRAAKADDPTVFLDLLEELGKDRKATIAALERAKAEATSPAADALGECGTLVGLLAAADGSERDELRHRIKGALRRLVEDVWVVVVRRGNDALVQARLYFRGGRWRSYLILYRPGKAGAVAARPGQLYVASLPSGTGLPVGNQDLRDPDEAEGTRRFLESYPVELMDRLLRGEPLATDAEIRASERKARYEPHTPSPQSSKGSRGR